MVASRVSAGMEANSSTGFKPTSKLESEKKEIENRSNSGASDQVDVSPIASNSSSSAHDDEIGEDQPPSYISDERYYEDTYLDDNSPPNNIPLDDSFLDSSIFAPHRSIPTRPQPQARVSAEQQYARFLG